MTVWYKNLNGVLCKFPEDEDMCTSDNESSVESITETGE